MNDLEVIRRIESKLEAPLRKISLGEIEKVAQWPTKAYALDDNGNVIGLQLDGYAISLNAELADLCHLTMLTLRDAPLEKAEILKTLHGLTSLTLSGAQVTDVSFLKELKGLTSLDLSGTQVTDVSFLKELKGLTSLDLSGAQVTDVSFLKELKGLTSLDLYGAQVTDVSFLKEFKGLTSLDLRGTEVSDVSFLKELKGLTRLSLSRAQVTDVSFLKEFKGLTSLSLSRAQVTDVSFLKEFKGLTNLVLSGTKVTDVSFLKELKGLTRLFLYETEVTDVSFLKEFKGLTSLHLYETEVTDVSFLKELKGLTKLVLSRTKVTDVSFLKELKGLTSLNLFGIPVTDVSFLKELKGLTRLSLSETEVTDVSFLKELKGLTSLDLSETEVTDVSFLKELKGLTSLDLSRTEVTDVSFLKELKGLTRLDLFGTKVADVSFLKELKGLTSLNLFGIPVTDVSFLKELKGLTSLYLSGTKVTDLSFIESLPSLVRISIYGAQQLEEPPLHIAEKGHEAIRNYFRQKREQGKGYLHEAKVLVVGEPGAGKTSMRKKLIDPNYTIPNREEVSTLGVEVEKDWHFPFIGDNTITFHASLWDFGGQDIQYMIHQYFLTGKSLYILVADERKQNTHYEYWFNIIKLLGEGSPVLVVLNKREGAAITSYDHIEICKAFPDLRIERFELDMAKENKAFDALREKIRSMLCKLDHIGAELPAKWPLIREKIEEMKVKNHISLDEYFKLCTVHGIKDEKDALFLADYLHILGTILHFKDDDLLRDLVITNPNWVVDALYTALSDKEIEGNCGLFTRDWLFNLWKNPKRKGKKGYTEGECRQLLNLMKKERFELCYEVDERQFISPQLLPQSPPVYSLEFKGALEFRFRYAFMPEGLLSRLIVRLNHLIRKDAYRKQLVWRYGVILERDGCIAEVTQTRFSSEGHRDISVRVVGQDYRKKELLTIIGNEIEAIHRKSFKHINFKILIPCNTSRCASSGNPKLFPLDELNKLAGYGDFTTRCTECGEMVDIYALVAGMAPDECENYRSRNLLLRETRKYGEMPLELFEEGVGKGEGGISEIERRLLDIMEILIRNPARAVATANAVSTSTATADVTVNIDINAEVKGLGNIIELIKEDLPMYVQDDSERQKMEKELELVKKALEEVTKTPQAEAKSSKSMTRLRQFIDKLENADTNIGKVIKTIDNGIEYARKLADFYNGIAQWCGLPQVPRPFVK